jgi:cytochrome c oxidase subunit II
MLLGDVGWAVMLGGTLVFAVVMVLGIFGTLRAPRTSGPRRLVLSGGLALPLLALIAALVYALIISEAFSQEASNDALRIELQSKRGWWEVRYTHERGRVLTHELRVPVGRTIELVLSPNDSFWGFRIPELGALADVVPGHAGRVLFTPRSAGVFRVQGTLLDVIASEPGEFEEWLVRQAKPSITPTDPLLQHGREAFFRGGCDACHTIRGTGARGRTGPDLTHVGARPSLAADSLDHHIRLAGARAQAPAASPAHQGLELRAVAGYLASLK